MQFPSQAVLQQTPLTQNPLKHPAAAVHEAPSGCGAEGAALQVPTDPATSQAIALPVQAVSQQTPSTQNPLAHSLGCLQVAPFGCGVEAAADVHVPREPVAVQVMELSVQAVLQQTPSTQNPLKHSAAAVQEAPSGAEQMPMQALSTWASSPTAASGRCPSCSLRLQATAASETRTETMAARRLMPRYLARVARSVTESTPAPA
jgi:hypothetical protein